MKQGTRFLLLLLVAVNAQKVVENISNSELKRQLSQIENEQTFDNYRMKSVMDRILQSVEENKKQMDDVMMMLAHLPISERACQRMLAAWSFGDRNMTMFFKLMGRTFYYNMTLVTWYENRDWCSSRGMQLATLKTAGEVEQVRKTLKSKHSLYKPFWVSASDIGRSHGQFHWADGTPVLNSTWKSGEPNNHKANQETCTVIETGLENLIDWPCLGKWYTLCEVPELLATCI